MNKSLYLCALAGLLLTACTSHNDQTTPVNLRTEFLSEPIGLDTQSPRFTWEYDGAQPGFTVSKQEIQMGTEPHALKPYTEGTPLQPHTRYYWTVKVWDEEGRLCAPAAIASFETAKFSEADWKAQWITDGEDKEFEPAPLFRKPFQLTKALQEARLYVASAGYHELFINGQRVGENYLDPGYTDFRKRILYVTHDVTDLLTEGNNALAAVLGNGWYNEQSVAVWNFHEAAWRGRPSLRCELRLTYTDGTTETVGTDETWKCATGGYTYNNIYSGDRFDAQLEEQGWKTAAFNDAHWKQAKRIEQPAAQLTAQTMPGIHITEELKPTAMKRFSDKLYVYSYPKNIAGFCRLKVKGEKGTRIKIRHGELLKADGRLEQGNINVYYHPVKPGEVFQMDEFILRGEGEETFMPAFTYHGFQYAEVESDRPIELTEESLTALFVHTDLQPVGDFSCSLPLFNKIWNATMQAYLNNIHSIPTDCPQREKNGWTADAHVAIDLGLLGFDGITFYEKWMNDFIDNQQEKGDISGIIPSANWGFGGNWPGPVWDAALFIIPNTLYNYYGTTRSIERLYPTMERYLAFEQTFESEEGTLTQGIGDWVFWKTQTNTEFTSTAYYYLDNRLMAYFAKLLGKDGTRYQQKAEQLKALINKKFFDAEKGLYAGGTQASQAVALYLGLVPAGKEQLVADQLHRIVAENNYFLDFGLLGSKTVPAMLTQYGYLEDVMKMATKTEAPSWGYWVETMGYTTLPETWTLSPQFNDASLNHVFMGDISAWMMNQLAGINHDPTDPGFHHILLTPHFPEGMDWAKGRYHSVKGEIVSEWKREADGIHLTITIPADCTAELRLPQETQTISAGTHQLVVQP